MLGAIVGGHSLRRRQNGGQGASKAFGAVKKGVKTAQWAQRKTEKPTVPPARSSMWCQQWVKMAHNGSKWLKIGPKWPTVGSKWLKMAHSRVKMGQNGSKCPTVGSGSGQSLRRGQKGGQNGSMGPTKNRKANSASGWFPYRTQRMI